jgi:flagellar hook-associated protein 1
MGVALSLTSSLQAQKEVQNTIGAGIAGLSTPDATALSKLQTQVVDGKVVGVKATPSEAHFDAGLQGDIQEDLSTYQYHSEIKKSLTRVQSLFGNTESGGRLVISLTNLDRAFSNFAARPEQDIAKSQVITAAEDFANKMKEFEKTIQQLRQEADNKIGVSVAKINENLKSLNDANQEVIKASFSGTSTAASTSEQFKALQSIAEEIDISVVMTNGGKIDVYTKEMVPLYASFANELSFAESSSVTAASTLNGVQDFAGNDITAKLRSGAMKSLFELRDTILPNVAQDMNELAVKMKESINEMHNKGVGFPPPTVLTGTRDVQAGDPLLIAGNFRVGIVDSTGVLVQSVDVDTAAMGGNTVQHVINAINGGLGLAGTAAIANGKLTITANNGNSVAINERDSQVFQNGLKVDLYDANNNLTTVNYNVAALGNITAVAADINANHSGLASASVVNGVLKITQLNNSQIAIDDGPKLKSANLKQKGVSHFFGLNDFFVGSTEPLAPHYAGAMAVRRDIKENVNFVSHGYLSETANNGQPGITYGGIPNADNLTVAQQLADVFGSTIDFDATNNLSGGKLTFTSDLSNIIGKASQLSQSTEQSVSITSKRLQFLDKELKSQSKKSLEELFTMMMMLSQVQHATANSIQTILQTDKQILAMAA